MKRVSRTPIRASLGAAGVAAVVSISLLAVPTAASAAPDDWNPRDHSFYENSWYDYGWDSRRLVSVMWRRRRWRPSTTTAKITCDALKTGVEARGFVTLQLYENVDAKKYVSTDWLGSVGSLESLALDSAG